MTIDARVEMWWAGEWHDITGDVDMRTPIMITHGRADEHGQSGPTTVGLVLDDTGHKYAPKDPRSELFGLIGRGTPLRVRVGDPQAALVLAGRPGSFASTPDHDSLDITGDIDIRIEVSPDSWRPDAPAMVLASKYLITGNERSWAWRVRETGAMDLHWSETGASHLQVAIASASVPDGGRLALRVTLEVDTGSGRAVRFWTAPSIQGPWTQLGDTQTGAATSIHAGTSPVEIGTGSGGGVVFTNNLRFSGRVHAFELRDGIDGALVTAPGFPDAETTVFTDEQGRTWTVHKDATIEDPSLRASVSIPSWQPAWDETTLDSRQVIEGAGILRRLGAGRKRLRSALYRDLAVRPDVVAYWPCEDEAGATQLASARNHRPMQITGAPDLASFTGIAASEPLPVLDEATLAVRVPAYDGAQNQRFFAVVAVPEGGVDANRRFFWVSTTGSLANWEMVLTPAGAVFMRVRNADGDMVQQSLDISFALNGKMGIFSLWLDQATANSVNWQMSFFEVGSAAGAASGDTVTGTYGRMRRVGSGVGRGLLGGVSVGHFTVLNDDVHSIWDLIGRSLDAWSREPAGVRMARLASDEGVPLQVLGDPGVTEEMGAQRPELFLSLFEESADVDLGILGERQDHRESLQYRTRVNLYRQDPALELDMADGELANPFDPPLDDQGLTNDVTVERFGGSSARAIQEDGPLAVSGFVGRHDDTPRLNLAHDGQLAHHAGWRLHLGTVDEHRVATLEIELEHNEHLIPAVLAMRQGDLVRVHNLPPGLPPGPLDLIAQGWRETITPHTWRITVTCTPGSPWAVGVIGDNVLGRADTAGSRLALDLGAPGVSDRPIVETITGPTWVEDAGELPFDVAIGGEVATVTGVETVRDEFARTVTGGWGTSTSGQAWTVAEGSDSDFSVSGATGRIAVASPVNRVRWGVSARNIDLSGTVGLSQVATGNWITVWPAVRELDASNFYLLAIEFKHTGLVGCALAKVVDGVGSGVGSGIELGAYSAHELFGWRFAIVGSQLLGRLWRAADPEPSTWTLKATDTDLPGAGNIAIRQDRFGGNTNTGAVVSVGDIVARNIQAFTADRDVNGIERAWPAGTDVRLAHPMIAPL